MSSSKSRSRRNAGEITQLIGLADRQGRVCVPGHNYAYIPEFARIRRLVRDGSLGVLRLAAVVFAIAHPEEVARHYDGVTWLVMPHHAYLMHGMLGMPGQRHGRDDVASLDKPRSRRPGLDRPRLPAARNCDAAHDSGRRRRLRGPVDVRGESDRLGGQCKRIMAIGGHAPRHRKHATRLGAVRRGIRARAGSVPCRRRGRSIADCVPHGGCRGRGPDPQCRGAVQPRAPNCQPQRDPPELP